jgi:hypothetical protein
MNLPDEYLKTNTFSGICYGIIQADLVHLWLEESDPVYETNQVDELNHIYPEKPTSRVFEALGYEIQQNKSGHIVVFKSPYYTHGLLLYKHIPIVHMTTHDATTNDPKCYCFGPEFYDKYNIPHDIYEITTGKLIHKNKWIKLGKHNS